MSNPIAALAPVPGTTQGAAPAAPRDPAAWAVAQEFEGVFVAQMLELASASLPVDGAFGGGSEERIYRSMMNTEYAKGITQRGGLGIAENVYREIIALQEASR